MASPSSSALTDPSPPRVLNATQAREQLAQTVEKSYGAEVTMDDMSQPHNRSAGSSRGNPFSQYPMPFSPDSSSAARNNSNFQPILSSTPNRTMNTTNPILDFSNLRPGTAPGNLDLTMPRRLPNATFDRPATADLALEISRGGGGNNPNATYDARNPNATYDARNPNATYDARNPNATYDAGNPNAAGGRNMNETYAAPQHSPPPQFMHLRGYGPQEVNPVWMLDNSSDYRAAQPPTGQSLSRDDYVYGTDYDSNDWDSSIDPFTSATFDGSYRNYLSYTPPVWPERQQKVRPPGPPPPPQGPPRRPMGPPPPPPPQGPSARPMGPPPPPPPQGPSARPMGPPPPPPPQGPSARPMGPPPPPPPQGPSARPMGPPPPPPPQGPSARPMGPPPPPPPQGPSPRPMGPPPPPPQPQNLTYGSSAPSSGSNPFSQYPDLSYGSSAPSNGSNPFSQYPDLSYGSTAPSSGPSPRPIGPTPPPPLPPQNLTYDPSAPSSGSNPFAQYPDLSYGSSDNSYFGGIPLHQYPDLSSDSSAPSSSLPFSPFPTLSFDSSGTSSIPNPFSGSSADHSRVYQSSQIPALSNSNYSPTRFLENPSNWTLNPNYSPTRFLENSSNWSPRPRGPPTRFLQNSSNFSPRPMGPPTPPPLPPPPPVFVGPASRPLPITQAPQILPRRDPFMEEIANYLQQLLLQFRQTMMQELPSIVKTVTTDKLKSALPKEKILLVIRATVPEMTRRLLRPMVLNSVDNMLNVILGDRTIPELFPKMAKQRIGCMKPCRCPNNRGPNGLPLPRASACGLDNLGSGRKCSEEEDCSEFDDMLNSINLGSSNGQWSTMPSPIPKVSRGTTPSRLS